MSNIPQSQQLTAKTKAKSRKVGRRVHESLVVWLWQRIDQVVAAKAGRSEAWFSAQARDAIHNFRQEAKNLAVQVGATGGEPWQVCKIPNADPALARAVVHAKSFQHELIVERPTRTGLREEKVGYVDIHVSLEEATQLALTCPLPFLEDGEERQFADLTRLMSEAQWYNYPALRKWAIDVRSELPPVGKLLQDLKTLRDHFPREDRTQVVVFCKDVSDAIRDVLQNEGFVVWTETEIQDLIGEAADA